MGLVLLIMFGLFWWLYMMWKYQDGIGKGRVDYLTQRANDNETEEEYYLIDDWFNE